MGVWGSKTPKSTLFSPFDFTLDREHPELPLGHAHFGAGLVPCGHVWCGEMRGEVGRALP